MFVFVYHLWNFTYRGHITWRIFLLCPIVPYYTHIIYLRTITFVSKRSTSKRSRLKRTPMLFKKRARVSNQNNIGSPVNRQRVRWKMRNDLYPYAMPCQLLCSLSIIFYCRLLLSCSSHCHHELGCCWICNSYSHLHSICFLVRDIHWYSF